MIACSILGDGTTTASTPVQVLDTTGLAPMTGITQVSAGGDGIVFVQDA